MTKRIVIGFDGSPESEEALAWAADEAVARGCRLDIVTCYRIPVSGDIYAGWIPTEAYEVVTEAADADLQVAYDAVRASHPVLEVTKLVTSGPPAHVLADDPHGDKELVVLGASSHRGPSAFWLGSTPRAVVRHATCPVVVVRGASSRGRPDRIVVGVDGSPAATRALRWAASEADLHRVELCVVHAWEYPYDRAAETPALARDLTRVDAATLLERGVELAREVCGGDVAGELVEGSATAALLSAVRDGDLLVVGSRGRGALATSVFGSTVNSVLDRADVPVAVVRFAGERC